MIFIPRYHFSRCETNYEQTEGSIQIQGKISVNDTVKLLRECNSGIRMGESALEHVVPKARNAELKRVLNACKDEHAVLGDRTHSMLLRHSADTSEAHAAVKMMSDAKIRISMVMKRSDKTIASLMTDGCNMGVKSLCKYLNQYKAADETSKDITKRLISLEERLAALEESIKKMMEGNNESNAFAVKPKQNRKPDQTA